MPEIQVSVFPSSKSKLGHISVKAVDSYWRNIFDKENLEGYSTHSSRRWLINILRRQGTSILTIAEIMVMTVNTVRRYCDDDPAACKNAILNLAV